MPQPEIPLGKPSNSACHRLPEAGFLLSGGLASLALWSWLAGVSDIFIPSQQHVPMAPSTALLVMLGCLAGWLLYRWPHHRLAASFGLLGGGVLGFAGLLAALRPVFGWASPLEEWLFGNAQNIQGIPVGQIAPSTGLVLLAVAVAVLLRWPKHRERPIISRCFQGLSAGVILAGATVLGLYAVQHGWSHGSSGIPMAAWTALSLIALGLGLLACSWAPQPAPFTALSRMPMRVGVVLVLIITMAGAFYLRIEQSEIREEARITLSAMADLKAGQITQWREERLSDARFFSQAEFVARHVAVFFEHSASVAAKSNLLNWLTLLKSGERYERMALFDTNLNLRLSLPDAADQTMPLVLRNYLVAALNTNQFYMADFHRAHAQGEVHLDLFCPIRMAQSEPPFGVLLIQIDPRQHLYPLIQSWPMPSDTAETLLVRKEGGQVVYLNELRHRPNTALRLRLPADIKRRLPAALAVAGHTGSVEGWDYRGVPVLASVRPVPDSPWFIVAKVDQAEIYAPLREEAWLILLLTLVLSTAAGFGSRAFWQQRETAQARRQLAAERERRALAERVAHLMQGANDAILILDTQWRILDANQRALQFYGYALEELRRLTVRQLRAPSAQATFDQHGQAVLAQGQVVFEAEHQRKDGSIFQVEVSARVIEIEGARQVLSIIRDITQRKQQEREIERLTCLYATLSQVNQGIVRVNSRHELFAEVCRVLIEFGRFKMAWIGWLDPETKAVHPVGQAGDTTGYIESLRIFADDRPTGRGPVGISLRTGRTYVCNDVRTDPCMAAWLDAARAAGFAASIALPIRLADQVCGALVVYAVEAGWFGPKEVNLLEETAMDISFGLDHLAAATERLEAEGRLRASEARFHAILDGLHTHIAVLDEQGAILVVNAAWRHFAEKNGIAAGQVGEGVNYLKVCELASGPDAATASAFAAGIRAVLAGRRDSYELEYSCHSPKEQRWFVGRATPMPGEEARRVVVAHENITERKQSEAELRASEAKFRTLVEHIPQKIFIKDRELRWVAVNAAFARDFGLPPEAMVGKSDFDFYPPGMAEKFRTDDQRILQTGQTMDLEEPHLLNRQEIWVHVVKTPVRDERGEITGVFGIFWDITERKRAEAQLRESENLLRESQFIAGMGSYVLDIPAGFWKSTEALDQVFGIDESFQRSVEGWLALIHPDDRARLSDYFSNEVLGRGTPFNQEYRIIRPADQTVRWVCGLGRLEFNADGRPLKMSGTIQDITDRKHLELERVALETQLRQQQKLESIGTLASGVAHEINNPINGVMNYAQLIMDENAASPTTAEYAKEIIHETERVATIVRNLLQFARQEKQSHSPAYVRDMIEQTLSLIRMVIKRDQITLQVELPKDLPEIKCRSQQIQQVLMNLLTNARDALNQRYQGHHADKLIQVRCQPFDQENRRWVRITVEDHGVGIPVEVRDRVFDPFFTTKPRNVGTGLGLSISHGIVKDHHGKLWFESTPGQGTKFHVELPVDNGWEIK